MYCTSVKPSGYRPVYDELGQTDAWVCSDCGHLSMMVFRKLTNMRAPAGAKALLSYRGERDGRSIIRWAGEESGSRIYTVEYHPYPRKMHMDAGESLLLKTWQLLDTKVDVIMDPAEAHNHEYAKASARGIAEVLALLMQPFLVTADEVVAEAVARWRARRDGVTTHVTRGLAEAIWDPTTTWEGVEQVEKPKATAKKSATKATGNTIPEAAVATSIRGIGSGMFTVDQIASMYKMTAMEVKTQLGIA